MGNSATKPGGHAPDGAAAVLLAAALLGVLFFGCATTKPKGPLLLHPVPPILEDYSLAQGASVFSGPDFSVSVRPWDYRLVAEEFRRTGESSPFGESDEATGRFLFLRVRLENRSARTMVFNPMRASLLRPGEAPLVPLENSDLFAFAGEKIDAAEKQGRAFRRVCFDITATVRPGQTLERYLVFRSPEEEVKQIALAIDDLWLGPKSFDLKFLFEGFPGK